MKELKTLEFFNILKKELPIDDEPADNNQQTVFDTPECKNYFTVLKKLSNSKDLSGKSREATLQEKGNAAVFIDVEDLKL